ncbi:hypothetical protein F5B19DRAFT_347710 [Rostrohypoxylon terebratum]|nr:hypothetical protein F5B19DRAFT_347710 [Rostrohypoxylon terebratum]
MVFTKTTAAACLLAFSALSGAEVTTTSTGTGAPTKAIHSITTTTTSTTNTNSRAAPHTSATSPAGKISTASSSHVPGVTHIPDTAVFLSIVPLRTTTRNDSSQSEEEEEEDVPPIFINATLPTLQTASCAHASPFRLTGGRLAHRGAYLATIADIVYQPLITTSSAHLHAREGAREIGSGFSVENGFLRWFDGAFYGGRARYCRIRGKGEGGWGWGL